MTRAKDISKILTDANISGTLDVTGETTLATHLNLGDNDKIKLGASSDLEIYHDGSNSYIDDTGTGGLLIRVDDALYIRSTGNENMIFAQKDGQVRLYHNNSQKLNTSSSGVTVTGGVTTTTASSIEGGVVFNEASADVDFRVESNGNANMINVDGGNNIVGIGRVPSTNDGGPGSLQLEGNDGMAFRRNGQTNSFILRPFGSGDGLRFTQGGTGDIAVFEANGKFLVGGLTTSNDSLESLQVYANGKVPLSVARQQDGTVVHFRSGGVNGAAHGEISISGVTCTYGAFTGTHWSRLSDNTMPTILLGTVIENIDEMCDWYQAEFTVKATDEEDEYVRSEPIGLPSGKSEGDTITHKYEGTDYTATIIKEGDNKHTKCKISDSADSKSVYGVFCAWDLDDDTVNDMKVASLGTHVVRIHKDVTVSKGDLIVSNGDGTAKVQDDDIIRSKTIGKVLTNLKQETYSDGSYTVPCALYCG